MDETSGSCPVFSSKLDSAVIKTLEIHSLNVKKCLSSVLITGKSDFDERHNVKKCLSNVLITGKYNFDERSGQSCIHKEVNSYKSIL